MADPADQFKIDKRRVRHSFDRAAATYDGAAVLQREICDRMLERLDYIKLQPERILDAGAGTGYGSRKLAARYAEARLTLLDLAPAMLQAARHQQSGWRRLLPFLSSRETHVCADIENLPLGDDSVDLIWSSLALQWCNDPETVFRGMHRVLRANGLLMFSTFGPDTLKELRQSFGALDSHTHVNRFIDMHDLGDALIRAGFASPVMEMETLTLTYDDVFGLMRDLKAIGAHNATAGRPQGLAGKDAFRRMQQNYERLRRDGKLPATYEVIYGHSWKGEGARPPASWIEDGQQVAPIRFNP